MTYLARFVTSSKWVDFAQVVQADPGQDHHLECPLLVLNDLIDKNGGPVSFWEIVPEDEDKVNRVVAAYCGGRSNLVGVKLRWVDSEVLRQLGVAARLTPAKDCPDSELAASGHWDLTLRDVETAARLAVALARNESIERTPKQIASYIVPALRDGRFEWKRLKAELVYQLLKEGHAKLQL